MMPRSGCSRDDGNQHGAEHQTGNKQSGRLHIGAPVGGSRSRAVQRGVVVCRVVGRSEEKLAFEKRHDASPRLNAPIGNR